MQLLLNERMKHLIFGSKTLYIITNWEPYFVVYFQITLVSQRHSSVLVEKHAHFMLMSSPSAHALCYTRRLSVITVAGLPFDQMEPSRSMQTRSGNPVRTPKLEQDFPDFWIEFYAGFYEWVNDRLMTNNYKQYFAASGVYFGLFFQTYFKSSRSV